MSNSYTRFIRHEHMSPETVDLIMELTSQVEDPSLRNKLYGLFDGYLYHDIPSLAKDLYPDLSSRLLKRSILLVYSLCSQYPQIDTNKDERTN